MGVGLKTLCLAHSEIGFQWWGGGARGAIMPCLLSAECAHRENDGLEFLSTGKYESGIKEVIKKTTKGGITRRIWIPQQSLLFSIVFLLVFF